MATALFKNENLPLEWLGKTLLSACNSFALPSPMMLWILRSELPLVGRGHTGRSRYFSTCCSARRPAACTEIPRTPLGASARMIFCGGSPLIHIVTLIVRWVLACLAPQGPEGAACGDTHPQCCIPQCCILVSVQRRGLRLGRPGGATPKNSSSAALSRRDEEVPIGPLRLALRQGLL